MLMPWGCPFTLLRGVPRPYLFVPSLVVVLWGSEVGEMPLDLVVSM